MAAPKRRMIDDHRQLLAVPKLVEAAVGLQI